VGRPDFKSGEVRSARLVGSTLTPFRPTDQSNTRSRFGVDDCEQRGLIQNQGSTAPRLLDCGNQGHSSAIGMTDEREGFTGIFEKRGQEDRLIAQSRQRRTRPSGALARVLCSCRHPRAVALAVGLLSGRLDELPLS
jgi:hypothetical protein